MRSRMVLVLTFLTVTLITASAVPTQAGTSVGGGIHYLRNLGDISDDGNVDLEQNSYSIIGSVKSGGGLFALEGQVEYIFDYLGSGNEMWQPSAWLLLGQFLYGGGGIGIGYVDGDWQDEPFYALRAGVAVPLGGIELDGYATYRFQNDDELKDLTGEDLDSLTFAALIRFGFGN